jgi:hypothetical protein
MGRHYDDYVVTGKQFGLTPIAGIPTAHPYERLSGKIRAAGVTGNIGEAVAAIFARRYLSAGIGDIAHIRPRRPFHRRKSPDYLMRLGSVMPGPFGLIVPTGATFTWPDWWPVESKARTTKVASDAARREALQQLAVYWSLLARLQPALAGYGLIVVLRYQPPRELRVSLILPRNQDQLVQELRKGDDEYDHAILRRCLHGC